MTLSPIPVAVLGAGGTGLLMAETVRKLDRYHFLGFLDDDPAKRVAGYEGWHVPATLDEWAGLPEETLFLSSLYAPKRNPAFLERISSLGIPEKRWATLVDPSAVVSLSAGLEPGVYVGPRCVVEPRASLGPCAVLLGAVYLAHHSRLGRYACCANSASVAGRCAIGEAAFIGANVSLREGVAIGRNAVVGLGSTVLESVAEGVVVAGSPARPLSRTGSGS